MEFIETTVFTKKITDLISDESYKDFQRSFLQSDCETKILRNLEKELNDDRF